MSTRLIRVKKNSTMLIFMLISLINVVVDLIIGTSIGTYLLFLYVLLLMLYGKLKPFQFLMYALFIPNKYLQLFAVLMYVIISKEFIKLKLKKTYFQFLMYTIVFGVLNCVAYGGLIFQTIFQVIVYASIFFLLDILSVSTDDKEIYSFLNTMFTLQAAAVLIQFLYTRQTMDYLKGTLISAHYLGVFLVVYCFILMKIHCQSVCKIEVWIRTLLAFIILVAADAKHVVALLILAILYNLIFDKFHIKNKITICGIIMIICTILGVGFFNSNYGRSVFSKNLLGIYLYNDAYNKKYQYITNTYDEMQSINGLVGFGVGQYGSQISITMSKGIIKEWDENSKGYTYAIAPFARAVKGLITEWYSQIGMPISSFALGYPLVSYVAMVAELGIIGYIWFCYILDKKYRGKNTSFIIGFIFLTVFDTYLEIPCVFVFVLLATNLLESKGKIYIK